MTQLALDFQTLPLEQLRPSKDNPRRDVGDVSEMAASMKAIDVLEPLVVTKDGDGTFEIIAGARRFAAAQQAGLAEVPVRIVDLDDRARAEVMLIENLQREDLAPLEEATAFQRLIELGYSQHQLAERIGRSQAHISRRIALLELPERAQQAVDTGRIAIEDALELRKLKDQPKRLKRVLQGGPGSWGWLAQRELADHERAEKLGKLVQEAKAGPHAYKPVQKAAYSGENPPKGAMFVERSRYGYGEPGTLDLDPKKHEKEPCHAVTVRGVHSHHSDPRRVAVCTDPSRHPEAKKKSTGKGPLTDKEKDKRKKIREHKAALREANADRWAFLEALLKKKSVKASVRDVATRLLIAIHLGREPGVTHSRRNESACRLLGLKPKSRQYGGEDYGGGVEAHLEKNPGDVWRVELAVAVGAFEDNLCGPYPQWGSEVKPYFALLAELGHEVSWVEKLELSGKAPR